MAGTVAVRDPVSIEEMRARYLELHRKCFARRPQFDPVPKAVESVPCDDIGPIFIPPAPVTPGDMAFDGPLTGRLLLRMVCAATDISINDVCSSRRTKIHVRARHLYFWIARKFTGLSLPQIGMISGGRDHTTVLHGCRRVDRLIQAENVEVIDDPMVMIHRLWTTDWSAVSI